MVGIRKRASRSRQMLMTKRRAEQICRLRVSKTYPNLSRGLGDSSEPGLDAPRVDRLSIARSVLERDLPPDRPDY
jgi:hypothetical protein